MMDLGHLLILCGATFLISILGVVTGGPEDFVKVKVGEKEYSHKE